jgi:hypothetical protein
VGGNPVMRVDPKGLRQQDIDEMNQLAQQRNPDLIVQYPVCVENLGGPLGIHYDKQYHSNKTGIITMKTSSICVDIRYLGKLDCLRMRELYIIIVHEAIHATDWLSGKPSPSGWGGQDRGGHTPADRVYKDSIRRGDEAWTTIKNTYCPDCDL